MGKTQFGTVAGLCLLVAWSAPRESRGAGLESVGNTDGVLTWRLGTLEVGKTAREMVLFVFDQSVETAGQRLQATRARLATLPEPPSGTAAGASANTVWITNGTTDFALEGACLFRWRMQRQSLACAQGGQLSQFAWYLHYEDADGPHRAGTINDGEAEIGEPPDRRAGARGAGGTEAFGTVETADRRLRVRVRARMDEGSAVAVEFLLSNRHTAALRNVRLSAYANIEAAHTHEGDYSVLDARTGGLLVVDPPTGMAVIMAGLNPPASGFSGTWNSMPKAQAARRDSAGGMEAVTRACLPTWRTNCWESAWQPQGIYLPYTFENPTTPETRRLTETEAAAALRARLALPGGRTSPAGARAESKSAGPGRWPIGWARALLRPNGANWPTLEQRILDRAGAKDPADPKDLYLAVRAVKRRIVFKNPAVTSASCCSLTSRCPRAASTPSTKPSTAWASRPRRADGCWCSTGCIPAARSASSPRTKPGSFWRPDLSFDGRRVLFCFKPHDEKSFHLYEMNLDGTGAAAADRQRLRRHRPDLPARRAHPLHHHARQLVRPLRAVHLLLHPGPLRRRRRQRLPDQLQRRAGLRAGAARRTAA